MKIQTLALLFSGMVLVSAAEASVFSKAWFKPSLQVDKSSVCKAMEEHTLEVWSGEQASPYPAAVFHKRATRGTIVEVNGKSIHVDSYTHVGCEGSCNQYQLIASDSAFPDKKLGDAFYQALLKKSPPKADRVHFLAGTDGKFYSFIPGDYTDELYELEDTAKWKLSCKLNKRPQREDIDKIKKDYIPAKAAMNELRIVVGGLSRGAGQCDSKAPHQQWKFEGDKEFKRLLYAPRIESKNSNASSTSTYASDSKNLMLWSLNGLSEFESFAAFTAALPEATEKLAKFYQKNFKWNKKEAQQRADYAIKYAVAAGIEFDKKYKPFVNDTEINLRKAILNKHALKKITAVDKGALKQILADKKGKTLIHAAVNYPEALSFLLENGFNANVKNDFNKTPLMYAAQYNNLASVQLLLAAGADVNSATKIPDDKCRYNLRTSNMTPLHYAVRYADRALIDHLVAQGAPLDHKVRNEFNTPHTFEYPVDWLKRFENPELSKSDTEHLQKHLQVPGK